MDPTDQQKPSPTLNEAVEKLTNSTGSGGESDKSFTCTRAVTDELTTKRRSSRILKLQKKAEKVAQRGQAEEEQSQDQAESKLSTKSSKHSVLKTKSNGSEKQNVEVEPLLLRKASEISKCLYFSDPAAARPMLWKQLHWLQAHVDKAEKSSRQQALLHGIYSKRNGKYVFSNNAMLQRRLYPCLPLFEV